MILMLLLEVRNLKNIIKLTITITIIIVIVIIMKIITIKVVLIIKLMSPRRHQPQKKLFILGDSMVKKLNGFLLTRKLNRKCLAKVRTFNLAKFRCMYDHAKPTVQDFDPNHIIYCRINDFSPLLTPQNDKLNNKAS